MSIALSRIPDLSDLEQKKIATALERLRPEYQERFLNEYAESRFQLSVYRSKVRNPLGILGAHYYYIGAGCTGALYTLTLGGVGVFWLIDLLSKKTGRKALDIANEKKINLLSALTYKRDLLMQKYNDHEELVDLIMNKQFTQGMPAEALKDSIGEPVAVDRKVLKTKVKEVWKYEPAGAGRFNLKISLDDDVVTGWEKKDA